MIRRGLSMPHSPRWYDGRLWLLESGSGQLVLVDPPSRPAASGSRLPGLRPRTGTTWSIRVCRAVEDSPDVGDGRRATGRRRDELKCGVAVVDLDGRVSQMLEFQTAVEEIFDVQLLGGVRFPEVMGFQQDTIQHTFIVPSEEQSPWLDDRSFSAS